MLVRSFVPALVLAAPLPAAVLPAAHTQQKLPPTLEDSWAKPTFRVATPSLVCYAHHANR